MIYTYKNSACTIHYDEEANEYYCIVMPLGNKYPSSRLSGVLVEDVERAFRSFVDYFQKVAL